MTCRCSSAAEHAARERESARISHDSEVRYREEEIKELKKKLAANKADLSNFTVEDVEEIGSCLLLKVKFEHKSTKAKPDCTFNGVKILVYEGKTMKDAIKWRTIDPHFRDDEKKVKSPSVAPSPSARFPGSNQGMNDAILFIKAKDGPSPTTMRK